MCLLAGQGGCVVNAKSHKWSRTEMLVLNLRNIFVFDVKVIYHL